MTKLSTRLWGITLIAGLAVACGTAAATPTQTLTSPPPTSAPAPATQAAPPPTVAGELPKQVTAGMATYARSCSRCHGPTLVDGSASQLSRPALARYGTAQRLHDYLRRSMPKGNPGGLSEQEYYDVAAYLLFRQGFLTSDQSVDAATVGSITLGE